MPEFSTPHNGLSDVLSYCLSFMERTCSPSNPPVPLYWKVTVLIRAFEADAHEYIACVRFCPALPRSNTLSSRDGSLGGVYIRPHCTAIFDMLAMAVVLTYPRHACAMKNVSSVDLTFSKGLLSYQRTEIADRLYVGDWDTVSR